MVEQHDTTNAQLVQQLTQLRLRLSDLEAQEADCQQERAHWKWTAELLRLVADFTCDWEYWIAPEGQFLYVSPSCERITGHRPDEFYQDPGLMLRLVHPDDRAAYKRHLTHELDPDSEPTTCELRLVTDTGEVRWIAHVCQSVYDANGVFLGRRVSNRDITSAKRDELHNAGLLAQYAHQEQFLDSLIQHASVGIAVVDREYRYLLVNPVYQRSSGASGIPMVGHTLEEVFPDVAATVRGKLEEVFRTGRPVRLRGYEVSMGPGSERTWWNVDNVPLLGTNGSVRQVLILTQEVTDQLRAHQQIEQLNEQAALSEAQLAEERARLKAIFDSAPEGIVVADALGRVVMANAAAARIYARPVPYEQDWSSHAVLQLCYPDGSPYDPRDLPLTRSALDGEALTGVELDIVWPDGQRRNLLVNSAPARDEAGRMTGAVSVFQDITVRKREQAEHARLARNIEIHAEALRAQNETLNETRLALAREWDMLQTIMENTHANLAYLDRDFRFVRVNSSYARQSGYRGEELIGRGHFDLFPHAENEAIFQRVRDTGEPVRFQARPFVYPNQPELGTTYWDWTLVPIKDETGRVEGLVFSLLDVTERERAGKALREREGELEELNETLEQRVAERTALAEERAAQLRALAVELTQAEERERRRLAQNLHDNLQQLLAAAKISVNIVHEQLADEAQRSFMGQVDALLDEAIATSRSLTTELSSPILYDAGLGAALCALGRQTQERHHLPVIVEADTEAEPESESVRVLLFQAVRELLFNVVKHAHASQAYVHMICEPENQVCITVGDDGVGFPMIAQTDLNQGFGLFSIRERLELMGGSMAIESVPGQGTLVRLYAPLYQEPSVPQMGGGEREGKAPAPALSREAIVQQIMSLEAMDAAVAAAPAEECVQKDIIRVLLVDDHEIMREGLASLLVMEEGIEIMAQAPDGETAVDLAHRLKPDVIVMDVSLPGISGVEATRRILATDSHVAIIGLSMHEKGPIAQAMRDAGAAVYLTKGGPSDALIAAIRASARQVREKGASRPKTVAEDAAHS